MGYINKEDLRFTTIISTEKIHLSLPYEYKGFRFKPESTIDNNFNDYNNLQCSIEWELMIELRPYGVKMIRPFVNKVNIFFNVINWDSQNLQDEIVGAIDFNTDDESGWDIEIDEDEGFQRPKELEIDLENKTILVRFSN